MDERDKFLDRVVSFLQGFRLLVRRRQKPKVCLTFDEYEEDFEERRKAWTLMEGEEKDRNLRIIDELLEDLSNLLVVPKPEARQKKKPDRPTKVSESKSLTGSVLPTDSELPTDSAPDSQSEEQKEADKQDFQFHRIY